MMATQTIYKTYTDKEDWFEISLEDCLKETEGKGYYAEGVVEKILDDGQVVRTPFAWYSVAPF